MYETKTAKDTQVGGDHYKNYEIQPIDYIIANDIPFVEGNIIKYVTRWRDKGGVSDLRKAQHYIQLLIEVEIEADEAFEQIERTKMEAMTNSPSFDLPPPRQVITRTPPPKYSHDPEIT